MKYLHTSSAIVLILIMLSASIVLYNPINRGNEDRPFNIGVSFCGNTTAEAKLLIERVKTYTNLFVLQSGSISKNESAINEICDYAIASGLRIIVYFGWFDKDCPWQVPWLDFAKQRWGNRFLGVYYYDEPGGIELDYNWSRYFNMIKLQNSSAHVNISATVYQELANEIEDYLDGTLPRDYDKAAKTYIHILSNYEDLKELYSRSIKVFTSDYALYWFDYLGGYDVVLAQLGWNHSVAQDIALVRGAAQMQNKSWGVMITWKYEQPPYLDNGDKIYEQMRMAYEAGAEYITIFNYPYDNDNPYGTLREEHFEALERFWEDTGKSRINQCSAEAVLVIPRNYGWGMRHPDDKIWFWGPDEKSSRIWNLSRKLLTQYSHQLDIVYDDLEFLNTKQYTQIYYWND